MAGVMKEEVVSPAVTLADVQAARERILPYVHRTPVLTSRTLDERVGARIFFKCEIFQRVGAFKARGAFSRLTLLTPEERSRGVVAFSSGNHAQAVALAARELGVRATIVMPKDAPALKVAATRGYGAEVILYDRLGGESREEIARRIVEEQGATLVPPFDDDAVIAGQGTLALELLEEVPDLDLIVTPCGGGGLLSGCAVAAQGAPPGDPPLGSRARGRERHAAIARRRAPRHHPPPRHHRRRPADHPPRRADARPRQRAHRGDPHRQRRGDPPRHGPARRADEARRRARRRRSPSPPSSTARCRNPRAGKSASSSPAATSIPTVSAR